MESANWAEIAAVVVAAIAAIIAFLVWRFPVPAPPAPNWVVEEITDPTGVDFAAAMQLLRQRIPEDERPPEVEICRWIREDRKDRWWPWRTRYRWFIAKAHGVMVGVINVVYSPMPRLAFLSFAAITTPKSIPGDAIGNLKEEIRDIGLQVLATHIARILRRRLLPINEFVMEVEDPGEAKTKPERCKRIGRIRLFCRIAERMGACGPKRLLIEYRQPSMTGADPEEDMPMFLLYSKFSRRGMGDFISVRDCKRILRFVYVDVYGSSNRWTELHRRCVDGFTELLHKKLANLGQEVGLDDLSTYRHSRTPNSQASSRTVGS